MALKRFLAPSKDETNKKKKCILKSLQKEFLDLEFYEDKIQIGRSKLTGISDVFCSKKQVLLKADFEASAVSIKVTGVNPSGLNGFILEPGKGYDAYSNDIIEILYGRYAYKVLFDSCEATSKNRLKLDKEESYENILNTEETGDLEIVNADELFIYTSKGVISSSKIASYDLDGTLIKTKSGNVFPKTINDWEIAFNEIPGKLKSLHKNGYKIVIFTNQGGISKGKYTINDFKYKLETIIAKLNVPIQAFVSTGDKLFRKPRIGMWNYLQIHKNDDITIDKEKSFFVGDAAGRQEEKAPFKLKKDHSCVDRLMALNLNLQFYTPEEHFKNEIPRRWVLPWFNPKEILSVSLFDPKSTDLNPKKLQLIVMVGLPGSGKSHFARKNLQPLGYEIINRDIIGNNQKCLKMCQEKLKDKQSCVIDNTNIDIESRKRFIDIAKAIGVPCRCFLMNSSFDQIKHNIIFRELTDLSHVKLPSMVFNSMKKKFKEPSTSEGFNEIVKVNIIPDFENSTDEELYRMYLVER